MAETLLPEGAKPEIKTDHIRKAVVVIGGFLVAICLVVLIKGVISPPRQPHASNDAAPAVAAPNGGAELSAYQEKLEQYRQSQGRADDRTGGASSSGAVTASSPEDASFVKQQLRLPMLVKDTGQPNQPSEPAAPATAPPNPAMAQRLADLQKHLAEIHQQQQTLENGGGSR
jgi:hypothetical protein